jgi:alkylhydroperoxidase family enzyme
MFLQRVRAARLNAAPYGRLLAALDVADVPVPEILYLFNTRPEAGRHFTRLMQAVMRGPSELAPALRETLAAFAAKQQSAFMLLAAHAETAGRLTGDGELVAEVLDRYQTAAIPDREKALFAFVERVCRDKAVSQSDVDQVLKAEWSEETVVDAVLICSIVQFAALLMSATGVAEAPPETQRVWARYVTESGYALD